MEKVVNTREWRKAKSAKLEFAFVSAFRDNSSFVLNILGPLCLWQCFFCGTLGDQIQDISDLLAIEY